MTKDRVNLDSCKTSEFLINLGKMSGLTFPGSAYDVAMNNQAIIQGNMLLKSYYMGGSAPGQMLVPAGYHPSTQPVTTMGVSGGVPTPSVPHPSHLPYPAPAKLSPVNKKFRPPARSSLKSQKYIPKPIPVELGNLKTYSNPDVLICGNCRELFNDLMDMIVHKKKYCKMRFTCKCESIECESGPNNPCDNSHQGEPDCKVRLEPPTKKVCLKCSQCKESFNGAWDLMFHVQSAHSINIYSLGERKKEVSTDSDSKDSSPERTTGTVLSNPPPTISAAPVILNMSSHTALQSSHNSLPGLPSSHSTLQSSHQGFPAPHKALSSAVFPRQNINRLGT